MITDFILEVFKIWNVKFGRYLGGKFGKIVNLVISYFNH